MYHRRVPIEPSMHGLAVVGMNVRPAQQGADQTGAACFVPDETAAAERAVATLVGLGHRRIAHISEAPTAGVASALRVDGYQRAMAAAGLGDEVVVVRTNHEETASDGAERLSHHLLTSRRRPTAIFAFNDQMAIGIYRTARRLGIEIPTGLSVIGFDDQRLIATELRPTLTTMALPHYDMGKLAAMALLDRIGERTDGNPARGITLVACPLRRRDSIGSPAPGG